ncbi:glycosyltransferase family 4 protein [Altererythrobacter sp. Root672]|uniref:glycosyltransferase family 4 protein n=1 Tax=Altererythrobacter sp. Root672 TaxID=1736584 RepID=UPI0006FDF3B1|nr:glycosyltransferase family 4 protein [Altererythrobacter sp. Root672]KRA84443.1 glycosyl transferase [Altererythrobacter sp. Root672]
MDPARSRLCVTGLRGIPGVMGGVETHCEELLPRVAVSAPEFEIEVLGRRPYLDGAPDQCQGVLITPLPSPRQSHLEAIISTAVGVFYARWKGARVLHIHAIGPAILTPLARLMGLKVVMTHHGDDYERAKWGRFAKLVLRTGERWGLNYAHHVIAVSPSLAERLAHQYPTCAAKVRYIPNGAPALSDDVLGSSEILSRFGVSARNFILAVGRFVPEKGFDYLIDAFRKSGTGRKLVIAGGADHGSAYARKIMQEAGGNVILTGQQPRPVLKALYQNTDLFVLPSFHEGLPITALEAGRCGAPMLLSDIQPNRDLGLGEANYFPVGDIDALADRMGQPSAEFGVNVRDLNNRFDWDQIAQHTLAVYREAAW